MKITLAATNDWLMYLTPIRLSKEQCHVVFELARPTHPTAVRVDPSAAPTKRRSNRKGGI